MTDDLLLPSQPFRATPQIHCHAMQQNGHHHASQQHALFFAALTGARISVAADAPRMDFPAIDIRRLREEFGFAPQPPLDGLAALLPATPTPAMPGAAISPL